MEYYREKENKKLRCGFTTGTCAAAAACAAAQMVLSAGRDRPQEIRILTPKGVEICIIPQEIRLRGEIGYCAVKKDSGDDPDVTNGTLVCASVKLKQEPSGEILIDGGIGVGRVTKPGLACKVGEAAINPVPRRMIREEVQKIAEKYGYQGCLEVIISIPEGEKLAEKTFNPKLGIIGGISVLGTSGIVEPMSEQALIDTIKVEINVAQAEGAEYLILTPGNYGETFLSKTRSVKGLTYVKCSNFIGDTLDYAVMQKMKGVLLVGHIGKLIKVAAGRLNTHSRYGDGRIETLSEHLEKLGGNGELIKDCVTAEDAVSLIMQHMPHLSDLLWSSILKEIKFHMDQRVCRSMRTEAMIYSSQCGYLGETPGTGEFLALAREKKNQKE